MPYLTIRNCQLQGLTLKKANVASVYKHLGKGNKLHHSNVDETLFKIKVDILGNIKKNRLRLIALL